MGKKLMPYAIFFLLLEFLIASDGQGSSGYLILLSIILLIVSLVSDLYNLFMYYKK